MNNEWIDVNKPWIAEIEGMDNPEFPTDAIEHYCLEKYGKTITELEKLVVNICNIGNEICEKFHDEFGLSLVYYVLPSIKHKDEDLEKIPELAITKALEYKEEFGYAIYPPHISCFYIDCLDYIKYKVAHKTRMNFYYNNSFCESDLYRPGVLIEVQYEDGEKNNYRIYEDLIRGLVEAYNVDVVPVPLKKGQALIWAANLLHGGMQIVDENSTRLTQAIHYFYKDCTRYYHPMFSRVSEGVFAKKWCDENNNIKTYESK